MTLHMKKIISILFTFILLVVLQTDYSIYAQTPNNYLQLNGGYVLVNSNKINSPSEVYFSAMIRPISVNGIQKIISVGAKQLNKLHYELAINGGSLSFSYTYGMGSQKIITAGQILPNTWSTVQASVTAKYTLLIINDYIVYETDGASDLPPLADTVTIGTNYTQSYFDSQNFIGDLDNVYISPFYFPFDQTRGETVAINTFGSSFNGTLIGGDNAVHFYGILPTPTPYVLTLPSSRWILPTLPDLRRTQSPSPTQTQIPSVPTATVSPMIDPIRGIRSTFSSIHR
jgi:hypothetical protein